MRAALVAFALLGCASAPDIDARGRAVLDATDPEKLGYCPAAEIARARSAVAFARAASQRGEPVAAAEHISLAEQLAAEITARATTCGHIRVTPPGPPGQPVPKPPDADEDGVEDALDRCQGEPEDHDGFVDNDGCRDIDDDGDGLSEVIDKCPTEPEDLDDFEDLDGCPEPGP